MIKLSGSGGRWPGRRVFKLVGFTVRAGADSKKAGRDGLGTVKLQLKMDSDRDHDTGTGSHWHRTTSTPSRDRGKFTGPHWRISLKFFLLPSS